MSNQSGSFTGDGIFLRFDTDMAWTGYAVPSGEGLSLFSLDGEWIGYFIGNSAGEYNLFDLDGRWPAKGSRKDFVELHNIAPGSGL